MPVDLNYKTRLPWILGAIFFVIYILTLNRWVTLDSLAVLAPIVGWDFWGLRMNSPLFRLVTSPCQLLSPASSILFISVLNAVLASFSLVWLARAVMLLPQDRCTDQRVRNDDPDGLYVSKLSWIPPLLAVCSLGFMFAFWEDATGAFPAIINVFFLSYIVRNTLEYRLDGENFWIYRAAAVYSIALVNNWVMILLLPFWIGSLIWINGTNLLRYSTLIVRSFLCFLPGLLFFLYTPTIEYIEGRSDLGFFNLLAMSLKQHASSVTSIPPYILFIFSTFSIIPLILLSIKWDQSRSSGGNAGINTAMTRISVRLMNLFFFLYAGAVAFELPVCPSHLTPGFEGLEFHYIAALVLGFATGYLLIVFHEPVTERRQKRFKVSDFMNLIRPVIFVFVLICGVAMLGGLIYKNYPQIQANNSNTLYDLGCNLLDDIQKIDKDKPVTLLSDDPTCIYLVRATMARKGVQDPYIFVDTRFLSYPWYHRRMAKFYPERWKNYFAEATEIGYLDNSNISQWLMLYAKQEHTYYLHPSFGYFFEACKPTLSGLLTQLTPYQDDDVSLWVFSPEEKEAALNYWKAEETVLDKIPRLPEEKLKHGNIAFVAAFYSRMLNNYAVELAKANDRTDAIQFCEEALSLYPRNLAAYMNKHYYQTGLSTYDDEGQHRYDELFNNYNSSWETVSLFCGKPDLPRPLYEMGTLFSQNHQWRQAYQCFLRVQQYEPNQIQNMTALAYVDSMIGESDRALKLIREAKAYWKQSGQSNSDTISLDTQEAACLLSTGKTEEALALLNEARKNNPQDQRILNMLSRAYIENGNYQEALTLIDRILTSAPDNFDNLYRKAICLLGLDRANDALNILDNLLRKNPLNNSIISLRITALLKLKRFDEARAVYEGMLREDKDDVSAMIGLGKVAEEAGNPDEALKQYERALSNEYILPVQIGWIVDSMLAMNKTDEARKVYEKLLQENKDDVPAMIGMGKVAEKAGDNEGAIKWYTDALNHKDVLPAYKTWLEERLQLIKDGKNNPSES
ncbi:MAG: tetratricopeptide repeat protein [Verrucomicrobia bacterium]|nr:tetratricopeptide repeat protein [Verrucomicrobiota bacterium]